MKQSFSTIKFIQQLANLEERQFSAEQKAAQLITETLSSFNISFRWQRYSTFLPLQKEAKLVADGRPIPAIATGFVSGVIGNAYGLISSLISSDSDLFEPNINFNPRSVSISRSSHYFAPSLAVSKNDLPRILKAKKIHGIVKVIKTKHDSANILAGNFKNPRMVIFCHYDSLGPGASDNASGVAICLKTLVANSSLAQTCLFVFAGNEELSYDEPIYWGHGYRVFERRYSALLKNCEQIFVLDSLGTGPTEVVSNAGLMKLAFPLQHIQRYAHKTKVICGEYDSLMPVYHSDLDTADKLLSQHLTAAERLLRERLSKK